MTSATSALRAAHKLPQDVVKDYLSAIWKHTIDNICKQQRRSIVELFPFRVILTVPSTWAKHPDAINRLNEAAKQAGILDVRDAGKTELDFVAEPEAAAFATLEDSRDIGEIRVSLACEECCVEVVFTQGCHRKEIYGLYVMLEVEQ